MAKKNIVRYLMENLPYLSQFDKELLTPYFERDAKGGLLYQTNNLDLDKFSITNATFTLQINCDITLDSEYAEDFFQKTWQELAENSFRYAYQKNPNDRNKPATEGYKKGAVLFKVKSEGKTLITEILDTGPGFTQEAIKKFYKRTQQIRETVKINIIKENTKKTYIEGDLGGLGLLCVQRYTENIGGHMIIGNNRDRDSPYTGRVQLHWPISSLTNLDNIINNLAQQNSTQTQTIQKQTIQENQSDEQAPSSHS